MEKITNVHKATKFHAVWVAAAEHHPFTMTNIMLAGLNRLLLMPAPKTASTATSGKSGYLKLGAEPQQAGPKVGCQSLTLAPDHPFSD